MEAAPSQAVLRILADMAGGDAAAAARLLPLVYEELRSVARRLMSDQRAGHTLQTTALVHEAYVKMAGGASASWEGRAHFLGVAAKAMRSVLIDHARARGADKRGGGRRRVMLEDAAVVGAEPLADLLALDQALERLTAMDGQKGRVVELRFFGGLDVEETARVMGVSEATVKREWRFAKAWLRRELEGADAG